MALQIWTPIVQPDTTSIAAGVSDFGRNVGAGLSQMADRMRQEKERDKERAEQAKKIRGMAKMFADELGLSPADIETADAQSLAGQVEGFMLANSAKQDRKSTRLNSSHIQKSRMPSSA